MRQLAPEQMSALQARGAELAQTMERDDYPVGDRFDPETATPEDALRIARVQRAAALRQMDIQMQATVDRARQEGLSWHRIGVQRGMTVQGARKRFTQAPLASA